jgi:hypothetical protein
VGGEEGAVGAAEGVVRAGVVDVPHRGVAAVVEGTVAGVCEAQEVPHLCYVLCVIVNMLAANHYVMSSNCLVGYRGSTQVQWKGKTYSTVG